MRARLHLPLLFLILACGSAVEPARAQQSCQPPPLPADAVEPSIFNEQQEMDLGEVVAEQVQRDFRVIEDEEITSYLKHLGTRLAAHLPPAEIEFRYFLVDVPVANAFSFPGGRIYVTRKLVALARSEDELAGVVAHEMGHMVTHEAAADVTRLFEEVLGVTEVSDRRDIFEKYNQLLENRARNWKAFRRVRKRAHKGQLAADRIGLHALVSAGYDLEAYVEFFDRLAQTEGETGSWLSDFFRTTKPESRRLREMLELTKELPAACRGDRAAGGGEGFRQWQAAVIGYSGLGRKEVLHGVQAKKALSPPLRGDITHLKFSPDGRMLLAQDEASIFVLSREPFRLQFRIDAPEALPAQFTPDAQSIVFHNPALRVERWSLAEEKREAVHELVIQEGCLQTALSPDGQTLACFDRKFNLMLVEVASGEAFFRKKEFYSRYDWWLVLKLLLAQILDERVELVHMGFSPDARYFAAGHREKALALDLTTRRPVSIPGAVKRLLKGGFVFLGPDRLLGMNIDDVKKSALVHFPSGKLLRAVTLGRQKLGAPTAGEYAFLRPVTDYPVGLLDLATDEIVFTGKRAALDLYYPFLVGELLDGQVSLLSMETRKPAASVPLPRSPLASPRAVGLSRDFRWLAVSGRTRGAVWDLESGTRVFHMRGFRGAHFGPAGELYVDFPKFEETDRRIVRMDPARRAVEEGPKVEEKRARQYGPFLVTHKPRKEKGRLDSDVILEVREVGSGTVLWSRHFPKDAPGIYFRPWTAVLSWPVTSRPAKNEIKKDPRLKAQFKLMKEKKGGYYLEVVEAATGTAVGRLLVETGKGSFRISDVFAAGDWVVIADTQNRVLVYSLSTGELKGRAFGQRADLSPAAGLLCVENERGELSLYDLTSWERRDRFLFSSPVSLAVFSPDGKRLFVLTASQTAYLIDVTSPGPDAVAAK